MSGDVTWREKITKALKSACEAWCDVEAWQAGPPPRDDGGEWCAAFEKLDGSWLDVPFNDGHGAARGCSFRLWTKDRVYFSHEYDGAESVCSVQRHPVSPPLDPTDDWCAADNRHVGG